MYFAIWLPTDPANALLYDQPENLSAKLAASSNNQPHPQSLLKIWMSNFTQTAAVASHLTTAKVWVSYILYFVSSALVGERFRISLCGRRVSARQYPEQRG
jgi:hypothetical protein